MQSRPHFPSQVRRYLSVPSLRSARGRLTVAGLGHRILSPGMIARLEGGQKRQVRTASDLIGKGGNNRKKRMGTNPSSAPGGDTIIEPPEL
jgi:hypothetical protein